MLLGWQNNRLLCSRLEMEAGPRFSVGGSSGAVVLRSDLIVESLVRSPCLCWFQGVNEGVVEKGD